MTSGPGTETARLEWTSESEWDGWPVLGALPRLELPTGRIVVVSAHPDDEVLGAGGLLASLDANVAAPFFVTATDGEASHAHAPGVSAARMAARRAAELVDSLHVLGHEAPVIARLRLPDSGLADHVDELAERLERVIHGADLVLSPSSYDAHIDHATVARVTAEVCASRVPVWEFPIWLWHWTSPADGMTGWERARRFDVSGTARRRKRAALARFTSQVGPLAGDESGRTILPPGMLAHFDRPFEVFFG